MKKKKRPHSVHRVQDEMREGLIVQQMSRQDTLNEEQMELWHRKRVRLV